MAARRQLLAQCGEGHLLSVMFQHAVGHLRRGELSFTGRFWLEESWQ